MIEDKSFNLEPPASEYDQLNSADREREPEERRKSNCQHCHGYFADNNEDWAMASWMVRIADAAVLRYKNSNLCVHCVDAHGDQILSM